MFQRFRTSFRRTTRLFVEQLEDRCVPANTLPVITSLNAAVLSNVSNVVKLTGAFTDPDIADPHSVIIDWKDNTAPQQVTLAVGARTFQVTHNYPSHAIAVVDAPNISVIVTDQAFASQVVATSDTFSGGAYRNTSSILGEPTRYTSPSSPYGGATTPFNPAFGGNEILSLNAGESVTVRFSVKVYNQSGADLLVFGNAFYNYNFSTGKATGDIFAEPGKIEVSQDGVHFFTINNTLADNAFPTNGYQNPTGPFDLPPAHPTLSDFGLPVSPGFNPAGMTLAQVVAAYHGSGGGTAVDVSSTGLAWIQYVRLTGGANGTDLDALSVVDPLPKSVTVLNFNLTYLDQKLGLYVDPTGLIESATGSGVEWLKSSVPNAYGNTWYYLTPDGSFVAWSGRSTHGGQKIASGTTVALLTPQIFIQPSLLYNATTTTIVNHF